MSEKLTSAAQLRMAAERSMQAIERAAIPAGAIVMWSGAQNNIPAGWTLCNGENGTPDLRGRFVLGAGGTYSVGATGGEETHALSLAEMPSHSHGITDNFIPVASFADMTAQDVYAKRHNAVPDFDPYITTETGYGMSHNNMPPYYALCYIMKL